MLKIAHLRCWCCKASKESRIYVIHINESCSYGYEWSICVHCGTKWKNYDTTEVIKTIRLNKKTVEFIYANIS